MNNSKSQSRTKSTIKVERVYTGDFQKSNTQTAELHQRVTTVAVYDGAKHSNSLQQNIFDAAEFGDTDQTYTNSEMRVAFIEVPVGTTLEQVQAKINQLKDATLYKILSNAPILHSNHKSAIANGLTTKDKIGDGQVVRYPADHKNAGEIIFDNNGNVQYRKVFFWASHKDDMDLRGTKENPPYITQTLMEELEEVVPGSFIQEAEMEITNQTIE